MLNRLLVGGPLSHSLIKRRWGPGAQDTRFTATVTALPPFLDRSRGGVVGDGKLHCAIAATGPATPLHCSVFLHRTSLPVRSPSPTNAMATVGSSSSSSPYWFMCFTPPSPFFLSSIYGVLSRTERNYLLDLLLVILLMLSGKDLCSTLASSAHASKKRAKLSKHP
jgi:hypothetical protein